MSRYTYEQFLALHPVLIKKNVGSNADKDLYQCPFCLKNTGKKKNKFYMSRTIGACFVCSSMVFKKLSIEELCAEYVEDQERELIEQDYQYWDLSAWTYEIKEGSEQFSYLKHRGITFDLIKEWNLRSCNVPYKGIVLPNDYDLKLSNFFQTRNLDPKAKLRYLNPSSLRPLYGVFILKKSDKAVICEGPFSVISTSSNLYNSIGLYGKSASAHQLEELKKLDYKTYVICLDGGVFKDIIKLAEQILEVRESVEICCLPYDLDPNEILQKHGKEVVAKFINNSISATKLGIKIIKAKFNKLEQTERNWYAFHKALREFNKEKNSQELS